MSEGHPAIPETLPFTGARAVAMVTGGARRVGRAIAMEFASRSLDVLVTYNTSAEEVEKTCRALGEYGIDAAAVALDLADTADTLARARLLAERLPRLDVLVHNASVYEPSLLEPTEALLTNAREQHAVNATSPLAISAALASLLGDSALPGGGSMVAMLDIHTEGLPRKNHATYAMSKAALGAMVRSLAVDLAPSVRVNGVAPGVIAWPETGPESDEAMQARYLSRVPLDRSGTLEEAAKAVAFLALDATYTTGQVLRVDGGRSLR